jgi:hypothetical protein
MIFAGGGNIRGKLLGLGDTTVRVRGGLSLVCGEGGLFWDGHSRWSKYVRHGDDIALVCGASTGCSGMGIVTLSTLDWNTSMVDGICGLFFVVCWWTRDVVHRVFGSVGLLAEDMPSPTFGAEAMPTIGNPVLPTLWCGWMMVGSCFFMEVCFTLSSANGGTWVLYYLRRSAGATAVLSCSDT